MDKESQSPRNRKELSRIKNLSPFRNIGVCQLDIAGISDLHREALVSFGEFARTHEPETPAKWCWIWPGPVVNDGGYGLIYAQDTPFVVYRLSFEWFKGVIPRGFVVMHECDKPRCWNPGHLFLGTQKENVQDMIRKGRAGWQKII